MNNSNQEELPFLASKDISLKTTPMFQQYLMIKSEYQECLLFFRIYKVLPFEIRKWRAKVIRVLGPGNQ